MRILITAGPTREPIDPVRYLSNRSSGKMGYAIAEAAADRGHEVILVSGPVSLPAFSKGKLLKVETAAEMFDAVRSEVGKVNAAVFSAAVVDYRPVRKWAEKIKKTGDTLSLELEKTEDILGSVRKQFGFSGFLVGFAAETNDLEKHAIGKLKSKDCDLLVANDVSRSDIGFDQDANEVTLFFRNGDRTFLDRRTKLEIAEAIVSVIETSTTV